MTTGKSVAHAVQAYPVGVTREHTAALKVLANVLAMGVAALLIIGYR